MAAPPQWLIDSLHQGKEIPDDVAAIRIGIAVGMGLVIAGVHYFTLGRRKSESTAAMPLTLTLLALLVCMVMLVVGDDIARAFTLGGTLAIIRYRTSVDDTRDTAFVIASVVAGMGIGTGNSTVIFIGIPVFALVLFLAFAVGLGRNGVGPVHRLTLRIAPDREIEPITAAAFNTCPKTPTLTGIETAKQGAALDLTYTVKGLDTAGILKLMTALRTVDGVQAVEMKVQ